MENIHTFNGSLCFDAPFEVEKNNLLHAMYYDKIINKDRTITKDKEECYEYKKKLVEEIKKDFNNCSPVMPCPDGSHLYDYKSRFLCHCVSVAKKFLDDDNHGNFALQFFLGGYDVSYHYTLKGQRHTFALKVNLTLHSLEQNGEIQTHLLAHVPLYEASADDIIFVKHLFYKKKLQCTIEGSTNPISIKQWLSQQFRKIDKIINKQKKENATLAFHLDNSLMEVTPASYSIYSEKDVREYREKHAGLIYGLLTSDEGWRFIDKEEAMNRTNTKWSLRPFECFYFILSNCLILNFDPENTISSYQNSEISLFKKYQYINSENKPSKKYIEYCKISPCIAGARSMLLFTFQDLIYRRMKICKAMDKAEKTLHPSLKSLRSRIEELRKQQDSLFKEIEGNVFGAPEMLNLQSIFTQGFGIPDLVDKLKEKYNRTVVLLEDEYDRKVSRRVNWLTIATICIGLSQILIISTSGGKEKADTFWSTSEFLFDFLFHIPYIAIPLLGAAILAYIISIFYHMFKK